MADKKKKGIFDAFSSRDEKKEIASLEKELAEAKKDAEASKKAIKSLLDQKAKASNPAEVAAAEKKIAELENKLKSVQEDERKQKLEEARTAWTEKQAAKKSLITTHTVESNNETLSHIALKYYKHATPPYWKYIVENNMEVLDGSEKNVRMGMKLDIYELPEELKD